MSLLRWLLVLVAAFVAGGCSSGADSGERSIEVVVPTEAALLDPRFTTRSLDIKITRLVHAGLVGLDPETLRPIPLVAESWSFDGELALTVTLRAGLRFHSGAPLTSKDVCATLEGVKDPALGSPHRGVVKAISQCEQLSPRQVRLELSEPRATLLTDLELPILRADQVRSPPTPEGDLDGLGPFRISKVEPGNVDLTPADTGLFAHAPQRAVSVRTVRDENARALRLLAGRADVAPNSISAAVLPAVVDREGLALERRRGANVTYLLVHNEREPLDRSDVRRALAQAIDRDTLVKTLLGGHAQIASWLFPPGHWASPPDLKPLPFSPGKARPVLEEVAPITLLTSTDRARVTLARAIAQYLGDAGLQVRVVSLDLGVLLTRLDSGDYELAVLQMPELTEPNVLDWFFHPSRVPGEGRPGKNRARYRSAEAGQLLDAAGRDRELERRAPHYHQLARLMARDLPVIPLWHEDQIAVVSQRAASFKPSAEGRWLDLARVP